MADHTGHWLDDLTLPGGRILKSGVDVFQRADGSTWASSSSPGQGGYDIPVKTSTEQGDTVELDLGFGKMHMAWRGDRFQAEWKQGGAAFPIEPRRHPGRHALAAEGRPPRFCTTLASVFIFGKQE